MTDQPAYMTAYIERFKALKDISKALSDYLRDIVRDIPRVDRVDARAKSPDRFFVKSNKEDDDGEKRYKNPLFEIQDQIGARITVFYLSDVEAVKSKILNYLRPIEIQEKSPMTDSEFGYFGLHFILKLPDDVITDDQDGLEVPEFFELQVKTLFQHAWSEAHHDLGYKSFRTLTGNEKRRIAFTAAQAWGADTVFEELSKELCVNDNALASSAE